MKQRLGQGDSKSKAIETLAALLLGSAAAGCTSPAPAPASFEEGGSTAPPGVDATADAGSPHDATSPPSDAPFANDAVDAREASKPGVEMYVSSGYQNRRVVSLDGTVWINDVTDPPSSLDDIGTGLAIGMGMIVVAGHTGIYTSVDAKSWTKLPPPVPQAWPGLGGAAAVCGGGQFVIVASDDSWTSADGVTFTDNVPDGASMAATHWGGLAYGNGHYFAVGDSNGPGDRKVSEDGVSWHDYVQDVVTDAQSGSGWTDAAFGAGVFVAVGAGGRRLWTTDGATINDISDATLGEISGVGYGDGKFVLSAANSSETSTDGKTWTKSSSYPASQLTFGGGLFLTTTWMSNILTSSDGQTWKTVFSGDAGSPALVRVLWGSVGGT